MRLLQQPPDHRWIRGCFSMETKSENCNPDIALCGTMLSFPENLFPHYPSHDTSRAMSLPFLTYTCVLCEDFLHFLSTPSITGHCLCEEIPKKLFGGPPATGSAEKSFSMKMYGEHVRTKTNLFLWHFEGKNQKMRVRRGRLFEKEREAVAMVHCITMRSFPPEM